jgi:hypothetical protein
MSQKEDKLPTDSGVQVFEVTMDNPEDQDELNRRLRKPGEHETGLSSKNVPVNHDANESGRSNG